MVALVQIGTNNLCRDSVEVIKDKYRKLFVHFENRPEVRLVVSGLLPRKGNWEMGSKIFEINRWLESYCRVKGFRFMSVWDSFYGNCKMYRRDLLHPSLKGAKFLGKAYDRVVCEIQGEVSTCLN